jgi:hypothetical protein
LSPRTSHRECLSYLLSIVLLLLLLLLLTEIVVRHGAMSPMPTTTKQFFKESMDYALHADLIIEFASTF